VQEDGSTGPVLVSSEKVGFCLRDDERMPAYILGFPIPETQGERPRARFGECDWQKQGLSPGWLDIYGYELDGQSLASPTGGRNFLGTLVDRGPAHESREGNNSARCTGLYGSGWWFRDQATDQRSGVNDLSTGIN
jgi:hypothetical protein